MSKELLNPDKALIFRIVHRNNLEDVLTNGCRCRSDAAGHRYVEIGNQELIQRRTGRPIPCAPGGTLSDYAPLDACRLLRSDRCVILASRRCCETAGPENHRPAGMVPM